MAQENAWFDHCLHPQSFNDFISFKEKYNNISLSLSLSLSTKKKVLKLKIDLHVNSNGVHSTILYRMVIHMICVIQDKTQSRVCYHA